MIDRTATFPLPLKEVLDLSHDPGNSASEDKRIVAGNQYQSSLAQRWLT